MDTSKLYVPNAARWINFFKTKKRETISQSGGGPNILPINELSTTAGKSEPKQQLNVDLVSPVEAATSQAEKQVKRRRKMVKRKYIKRKGKGNKTHSTRKVSKKNRRNLSRRKFNNKTKNRRKFNNKTNKRTRDIFG